ncbi:DUF1906 domain-containing protein [Actinospica durhamensis]|uniref:DUF1906 domain-containing protein n=1 Tax=Actinospica durhamensis TaxID=1508375 RepID=A0A941EM94_9ACTN|nr:glycoside hydrolase domain-containing protein [Actinospica durhamensis]MBR7831624.1 DUF1906 domain-containing protein [Actinospica durhamensis]
MDTPRRLRPLFARCLALSTMLLCAAVLAGPAQAAARAAGTHRPVAGPLGGPVLNALGFDTCTAPSVHDMAAWQKSSPYQAIGIYVGGSNRACGIGNLSTSWVRAVDDQGWSLIPIYVGLQAPCVKGRGMSLMSAAKAAQQGTAEANGAASAAARLSIAPDSPVYFDLEAFNENDQGCVRTVTAFLNAWTTQLHTHGYLSGVYGSADSGMTTLVGIVRSQHGFAAPDAIWIAHWDRLAKTADASVPDTMWVYQQRIKQYQGGHKETHGGVSIVIDTDYLDGPVARVGP